VRIALISDIHGHGTALDAVLADIDRQQTDSIICLGDVATVGPQPKQVMKRLQDLDCACLLGNHDAALLDLEKASEYRIAPLLIPTLHWCARQLAPEDFEYLRSFRATMEVPLGKDATVLCYHGSPRSSVDLVLATTPGDELDELFAGQTATVMAGGHSHIQMLRRHRGTLFLNPGSVGSAFLIPPVSESVPTLLPWAEYALIDSSHGVLSIDLRRVSFDTDAFAEVVLQSDVPIKGWWLEQYAASPGP